MRKAVILISLIVFGLAHGEWNLVTEYDYSSSAINGTKIHFTDAQHGWIVTDQGRVHHSNDSGKTWKSPWGNVWGEPDFARNASDIYFLNKDTIWFTGMGRGALSELGVIGGSTNGGSTWNLVFSDTSIASIEKILFTKPSDGYFFGTSTGTGSSSLSVMGTTKDGGATWTVERLDSLRFRDVFFVNPDTGWIVGVERYSGIHIANGGRFLKTVDGGKNWEYKRYTTFNNREFEIVNKVFFIDGKRGWIGCGGAVLGGFVDAILAYTEDGGDSWSGYYNTSDSRIPIIDMHFFNDSVWCFIRGGRTIYSTTNGGKDWEEAELYNPDPLNYNIRTYAMSFVGPYGWIVSDNSLVYRTTNYGGLSDYITSVNPQLRQRQNTNTSSFNMRISPAKSGISNIAYTLNTESTLSISIYNLKGKKVAFQPKRLRTAGEHNFSFKAPKGFYIVEAKVQSKSGENERTFSNRVLVK